MRSLKPNDLILRLEQCFVPTPIFGHFIKRKTALWPRFQIFPNFSKIKIRWNLLIWFLEIGHLRVSLGKIWAICQMGRWPVFLDPNSQHSRPQSLRSFWPAAGIESSGSNHFEITKEITEFCPSGLTKSSSMAHAWNGCSQSLSIPAAGQKDRRLWGREWSGAHSGQTGRACAVPPKTFA